MQVQSFEAALNRNFRRALAIKTSATVDTSMFYPKIAFRSAIDIRTEEPKQRVVKQIRMKIKAGNVPSLHHLKDVLREVEISRRMQHPRVRLVSLWREWVLIEFDFSQDYYVAFLDAHELGISLITLSVSKF